MIAPRSPLVGSLGAGWGLFALAAILLQALSKLLPLVQTALSQPLTPAQGLFALSWVLFMAWTEGYRGFQRSFSPRFVARAHWLQQRGTGRDLWLAPLFCMGFYRASRRTRIIAWGLTVGIALLVFLIGRLPQPWRGLVDLGVMTGLSWGLVSLLSEAWRVLIRRQPGVDPDV
jgi:hypothetical protein